MPKIFISYRRDDSQTITERIHDRLVSSFGKENVFLDVDNNIPAGSPWQEVLREKLHESDVLIVVIGTQWLEILQSRIHDENDYVRFEVETGLEHDDITLIVPILVNGAQPSTLAKLPESFQGLSNRQVKSIRGNPDFHDDMDQLITDLTQQIRLSKTRRNWKWITAIAFILIIVALLIIFAVMPSGLPVIADFDNGIQINNLGQRMGALYPPETGNSVTEVYENGHVKVNYVLMPDSFGGFWIRLGNVDFSNYKQLTFDISASSRFPIKIELKRTNGDLTSLTKLISTENQTVIIELSEVNLPALTYMAELVFIVDQSNAGTVGTITIDNIVLR